MDCSRKNECSNYRNKCYECCSMGDMMNPYPKFADKKSNEKKLRWLLNGVPELLKRAADSPHDRDSLVRYLVANGVRVEE